MVCMGFGFDVLTSAFAGCFVVGKGQAPGLRGDLGELLDDVEEGSFVLPGQLPAVGDGAGKNLFSGPVVRRSGVRRRGNRNGRLRLLRGRRNSCSGKGEAEGNFIHQTHGSFLFLSEFLRRLVGVMVAVVIALVLGGLAYDRTNAGASGSADDGALEATAEDCSQDRSACSSNEGAFAGADPTLSMVIVVGTVVIVVVAVSAVASVAHAVVVGVVVIVVVLRGKKGSRQKERGDEERCSELAHLRLDAELAIAGIFW